MKHTFTLRNTFIFDYDENFIEVKCVVSEFNCSHDVIGHHRDTLTMKLDGFILFCSKCIFSKQGEIDISKFDIHYFRETFDDRFFRYKDLQLFVGEVYILHDLLKKRMIPSLFKYTWISNELLCVFCNNGYLMLIDSHCLTVGYFQHKLLSRICFNVNEKRRDYEYYYNEIIKLNDLSSIWLERGACHPYVNLTFRDMWLLMSLSDFQKLQMIIDNRQVMFTD